MLDISNKKVIGDNNEINIESDSCELLFLDIKGNHNKVIIEEGVIVTSNTWIRIVGDNCIVKIGRDSTFEGTTINVVEDNNFVLIGEDCMFANGTKILASDYHSIIDIESNTRTNMPKGIEIGDHVWVGMDAIILKNCHIGNNSIIAANSTVVRNVESNVAVGGYPAVKIKEGITWHRNLLLNSSKDDLLMDKISESCCNGNEKQMFNIEKLPINNNGFLGGWAFVLDRESKNSRIYIEVIDKDNKRTIHQCLMEVRLDVAEYFQSDLYKYSGFQVFLKCDIKSVRIIIENNNELTKSDWKYFGV